MNNISPLYIDRYKSGLLIRDVFFAQVGQSVPREGVDVLFYLQASVPKFKGIDFFTSIIDLRKEEIALFHDINKGFRYEIRRASEKELFKTFFCKPTHIQLEEFFIFYDLFAASRKLPAVNRKKLKALNDKGAIQLGWVCDPERGQSAGTEWVSAHAYVVDKQRTRLYHSATFVGDIQKDRQRMGRANKLLHWQAILHFKSQGIIIYDMGGISMGKRLKPIDDFKRSFGGQLVREYNYFEQVTHRGALLVFILKIKRILISLCNLHFGNK